MTIGGRSEQTAGSGDDVKRYEAARILVMVVRIAATLILIGGLFAAAGIANPAQQPPAFDSASGDGLAITVALAAIAISLFLFIAATIIALQIESVRLAAEIHRAITGQRKPL